jgi:hypothetical protein
MTTLSQNANPVILTAQKLLNNLGVTDGLGRKLVEDGLWGRNTNDALKKFYATYGSATDEGTSNTITPGVLNDLVRVTNKVTGSNIPGTTSTTSPDVSSLHPMFQPIRSRMLPRDNILIQGGQGGPIVVPLDTTGNVQPPVLMPQSQSNTGLVLGIAACLVGIVAVTLMQKK